MSQQNIPQISADEVKKAIDLKADFILLDVRTPEEFKQGKISGSVNLPIDSIADKITQEITDKNKTIYLYCLSGSRSDAAVSIMLQLGYKNVFSMTNGLLMWRFKKYPLQ